MSEGSERATCSVVEPESNSTICPSSTFRAELRQSHFDLIGFIQPGEVILAGVLGPRQRPAVHPLHQSGAVQLGEIAADGVFGHGEMLAQLGGHDLAVALEDQEDFLPAQGGSSVRNDRAWFCLFVLVVAGFARLAKASGKHKPAGINCFDHWNHRPNFSLHGDLFRMASL
jgi:hypothetical protein